MFRFQKDDKTMDVCSELQASVFQKNGWSLMEIECVSVETNEIEATDTPEEVEYTEEIQPTQEEMESPVETQTTPEKQPSKRGRKPSGSK